MAFTSTCADIVNNMATALKTGGLQVLDINFKDLIDKTINLVRPAVNITINSAQFQKITALNIKETTFKCVCDISVLVVFNQYGGTTKQTGKTKEGIYSLLEAITQTLMIQSLGLPLQNPLVPKGFRNITPFDYAKAGYQIYQINFSAAFNFTMNDLDVDALQLESIVAKYFIEPGDETLSNEIAEDIISTTY